MEQVDRYANWDYRLKSVCLHTATDFSNCVYLDAFLSQTGFVCACIIKAISHWFSVHSWRMTLVCTTVHTCTPNVCRTAGMQMQQSAAAHVERCISSNTLSDFQRQAPRPLNRIQPPDCCLNNIMTFTTFYVWYHPQRGRCISE